jgi:hypothetical protein
MENLHYFNGALNVNYQSGLITAAVYACYRNAQTDGWLPMVVTLLLTLFQKQLHRHWVNIYLLLLMLLPFPALEDLCLLAFLDVFAMSNSGYVFLLPMKELLWNCPTHNWVFSYQLYLSRMLLEVLLAGTEMLISFGTQTAVIYC